MRVTYSREMKLKAYLDSIGISSYVPLQMAEVVKGGRKQKVLLPVIHNLIFIQSTRLVLATLKKEIESKIPFRYMMDKRLKQAITVPDKEMQEFMSLAGMLQEQLIFTTEVDPSMKKGARVRVKSGPFQGIEGTLVRFKRDRRVMVYLQGFMAVITAAIHPALLEIIAETKKDE